MISRQLPATRSDLYAQPLTTRYVSGDNWLAVHTDERPDYIFGNYLILDHLMSEKDVPQWSKLWREQYSSRGVNAIVFQWETDLNEDITCKKELPTGLKLSRRLVLSLSDLSAPRVLRRSLLTRQVQTSSDWESVVELATRSLGAVSHVEEFEAWRYMRMREKVEGGTAIWWGAWLGSVLVGSAGLVWNGEHARFQEVLTHPDYRKQGVATSLCFTIIKDGIRSRELKTFVSVADHSSFAAAIYLGMGFRLVGHQYTAIRLL